MLSMNGENLKYNLINGAGLYTAQKYEIESSFVLHDNVFDNDALIFTDMKSSFITLASDNHNRTIKFNFDSPLLGIWAKPGASYVCIEPWWGVNDNYDKKADISEKRAIMSLSSKNSASFNWNIEICE